LLAVAHISILNAKFYITCSFSQCNRNSSNQSTAKQNAPLFSTMV